MAKPKMIMSLTSCLSSMIAVRITRRMKRCVRDGQDVIWGLNARVLVGGANE